MAKIDVRCPACGLVKSVPEHWAGKSVRCPKCDTKFALARPTAPVPAAPTPAVPDPSRVVGLDGILESWEPGDVILGRYEVVPLADGVPFAEGGFGRVNRVRDTESGQDLAVKSVNPLKLARVGAADDFVREAEVWITRIGLHPNAVAAQYVLVLGDVPRVFIEFVGGGSLHDWITDGRLYDGGHAAALKRMLDVLIQFAWGLHYCHEQGLIHQDVKPGNVMMTTGGVAKVTDFGLAGARSQSGGEGDDPPPGFSLVATFGGMTEAYCSPEQAEIRARRKAGAARDQLPPLTRRTDLWSWAVSALQAFHGRVAWPSGSVADKYLKRPPEDDRIPPIPLAVLDLLARCLRRKPDDRPRTMAEVARELTAIYATVTGEPYPRAEPRAAGDLGDSLNNRAVSLVNLGGRFRDAALTLWDEATRLDPHHPETAYNAGLLRWRAAETTDAAVVTRLRGIAEGRLGEWRPSWLLAHVHLERGDCGGALDALGRITGLDADREEVRAVRDAAERLLPDSRRFLRALAGYTDPVRSVCVTGDGRLSLSRGSGGAVRVCEVATGRCLHTFGGYDGRVTAVCVSGDGRVALTGGDDGAARVWDVGAGRCVRTLEEHADAVTAVCVSGDGRVALTGGDDGTIRVWKAATGRCVRTLEGHTRAVRAVCASDDGRVALSAAGLTGPVRLWDVDTGECVRTLGGKTGTVRAVCLSGDGRVALTGGDDGTVRVWGAGDGRGVRTFHGQAGAVNAVCLTGDGRLALSAGDDGGVRLWDVTSGRCLRTFEGHAGPVNAVCLTGDGRLALSGGDDTVRVWEVARGWSATAPAVLSRTGTTEAAATARDDFEAALGRGLAAVSGRRWGEAATWLRRARAVGGYDRHPQIRRSWPELYTHLPRGDFRSGQLGATLAVRGVHAVCVSGDGRLAVSGGADKTVRVWDLAAGRCVRTLDGHPAPVTAACPGGDGRLALTGDDGGGLRLWDVAAGRCEQTFRPHPGSATPLRSVCLGGDGRFALAGGDAGVRLWDVATGRCLLTYSQITANAVAASGDGRVVVAGGAGGEVHSWEAATGRRLRTFKGHADVVNAAAVSPDGRVILSGADDGTVRVWEAATGQCVRVLKGHSGPVRSVCLTADGRAAFSGGDDRTVRVWDIGTGRCVRTLEGHPGAVGSVCLSRDGRLALSAGGDALGVWELDWDIEAREPADWDDRARPHLETFLSRNTPFLSPLPQDRTPTEDELTRGLTRRGRPVWTDEEFGQLLRTLGCAGFGWLRPEGVRRELEKMAAAWPGPPPLV